VLRFQEVISRARPIAIVRCRQPYPALPRCGSLPTERQLSDPRHRWQAAPSGGVSSRVLAILAAIGIAAAVAPPPVAAAATADEPDRPRVGLVLGGGGARGAAHIGVLKELERLRIPIDAIAGTSMGAIVGGLYASGLDAADLEQVVTEMDWSAVLSDRQQRSDLSFRRKQDDARFPVRLELGIKNGKAKLPQGAIQGHVLDLKLRELTWHVSGVRDFDDLPTPFRAVASDIGSGEPVVMGDGDLALALRASMSVPGAFVPVEVDGRLLVDGGLVGNLPVDVVREMGVDVVIAVDVEFPLYGVDELDSVLAVTEQMLTVLIRNETRRQIETLNDDDILIRPELGMHGSAHFGNILETLEPGESAARNARAELERLSLGPGDWQSYRADRRDGGDRDTKVDFVRVRNDSRVAPAVLEARMNIQPGDSVDPERLASEANRLYGLQIFEKVDYRLLEQAGRQGVVYDARKKSWGAGFLRFGIAVEDDFEGSTAFNLNARLWWPAVNSLGAEWRTDLTLGTDPVFATEYYQPLRADSRLFVAASVFAGQGNASAFIVDDALARFRLTEFEAALDLGAALGNWGEIRAGLFRGEGEARLKIGDPAIPNVDFATGGARLLLRADTFDNAWFPRTGVRGRVAWTLARPAFGADRSYDTLAVELASVMSRGRTSFGLGLDYGTTVSGSGALQDSFPLGGFLRLSGLERDQLAGPHAGLLTLAVYRRIGEPAGNLFEAPIYLGASLEHGNVWQARGDIGLDSMQTNGSVFVGIDSLIGPVVLAAGMAEGGRTNFYLFVGRSFIGTGFRRPRASGQY